MAQAFVRQSKRRFWGPVALGSVITLAPASLASLDFRAGFGRGLAVSTRHSSPVFSALEDLRADFTPLPDLAAAHFPDLNLKEAAPPPTVGIKYASLNGTVIHRPPVETTASIRVSVAASETSEPDSDTVQPLAVAARRLVRRALDQASPERVIASTLGTNIIVRGHASTPIPRGEATLKEHFKPMFAVITPRADRPLWLDGQVEMTGGLAFTGPEVEIRIKHVLDGKELETGRIWITEGRFEIRVDRPAGRLVAELRSRAGEVFGRGEVNINGLTATPAPAAQRIGDIHIALRPTAEYAALRAVSAYSHREYKVAVNQPRVEIQSVTEALTINEEGTATDPSLGGDSTYLARVTAPGHRASLAVAGVTEPREVRVLSNAMVDALIDLGTTKSERNEARWAGLVWGEVKAEGQSVSGAVVELDGDVRAIYFNDLYLPDANLKATSANGLFAFLNVAPGVRAARASVGAEDFPAQVFVAEDQHVSVIDFDLRRNAVVRVQPRDILNEQRPTGALLKVVGTEAEAVVTGDADLRLNHGGGPVMIEAKGDDAFEISRATLARDAGELTIPLVRRSWLAEMFRSLTLEADPARGSVVGFVGDHDFEVEMTGGLLGEPLRVVYFDHAGRVVTSGVGPAGGGFAILNAPPGLQTVRIKPLHAERQITQLVVAEPNLVHVVAPRGR